MGWKRLSVLLATLVACGGTTLEPEAEEQGGGAGEEAGAGAGTGGSEEPGTGGKGASAGVGASVSSGGVGGDPAVNLCARVVEQPPGEAISSEGTPGAGECEGSTLSSVIAAVRELRPDLADVEVLYVDDPERAGDGSFIYAFQRPDGGFALVFKRGAGDCPAGCTINDYWYFETGEQCAVVEVGETHRDFETSCVPPDMLPRWGIPPAAPPSSICDVDLSPQAISGRYELVSCGMRSPCEFSGDKPMVIPFAALELTIEQDADDAGVGHVTLQGTGEPLLDGQTFPATFERRRVRVTHEYSNLPSTCPAEGHLELDYDFEGFYARTLHFEFSGTPDCANPNDYCKGSVYSQFGEAKLLD